MDVLCNVNVENKGGSHTLDIFKTAVVKDIVDFKWNKFARKVHMLGIAIHVLYIIALIILVG